MPFGISAAPSFSKKMFKILQDLQGVECVMDDILVYSKNTREHDERLQQVMKRIGDAGMTLNKKKCQYRVEELIFLGHKISAEGTSANSEKVRAIKKMKKPSNRTELKSFLGMVNYLHEYSSRLAEIEKPLRQLNKKSNDWIWEKPQRESFELLKEEMANAPMLAKNNVRSRHRVTADSSSYALGAALLQINSEGKWQPVAFVSRKLRDTERRYAQLEKEALVITWAFKKFDFFASWNSI